MKSSVELADFYDPFFENSSPATAEAGAAALVLDGEKGELVRAPALGLAGDSATAEKAAAVLKNHSEAEKRRRERLNGHLATLRTLIPGCNKMDKASLLAKAITHLEELERNATEATRGLVIPLDSDEVSVEEVVDVCDGEASVCIKASVCCDYRHEILSDLKQSLNSLHLKLVRVEMGTFGGRMKSVFFMSSFGERDIQDSSSSNKYVSGAVQRALKSVLDSSSASQEFSSRHLLSSKRQRVSLLSC